MLKSRAIFLFMFCFTNILNIFFSFVICSMHKNPYQNAGNGIKETLCFKIFLGSIPPDPLEFLAPSARVGQIRFRPPPKFLSPYAYDDSCYIAAFFYRQCLRQFKIIVLLYYSLFTQFWLAIFLVNNWWSEYLPNLGEHVHFSHQQNIGHDVLMRRTIENFSKNGCCFFRWAMWRIFDMFVKQERFR